MPWKCGGKERKMKKISVLFLVFILLLSSLMSSIGVFAEEAKSMNAEDVLYALVEAENSHDWERFCLLHTNKEAVRYRKYFNDNKSSGGVKNVRTAALQEIQLLNDSGNRCEYIVGIDYTVSKEDEFYYNGVNYRYLILEKIDNEWKIVEYQDAPLENYIPYGAQAQDLGLDTVNSIALPNLNRENTAIALRIIKAREKGEFINAQGKRIDVIHSINQFGVMDTPATEGSRVRPEAIYIDRRDEDWGVEGCDFDPYCKGVLPNEWYASWPTQSLRAGAIAIVQYSAYAVLHPRHSSLGAHVCDSSHCQVFRENSETNSCNVAVDAVKKYYYETATGNFFQTCYAAGVYGEDYGHSGRMRQNGTHYWADQGQTWRWMMEYYYTDSNYNIPITTIVRKLWKK